MEKLYQHKLLFPLLFLILLHFSSLLLVSSGYKLPRKYFINCGSKSDIFINSRNFVGDQNSGFLSVGESQPEPVTDTNPSNSTSPLYQTARISKYPFSYKLKTNHPGTYLLRLHFFIFLSPNNLTNALFNVSASKFYLLSNFSVQNNSTLPVIKEFLLTIKVRKFRINFIPLQESSLAFVNAIEVFLVPDGFIPNIATHVTSSGSNDYYRGLRSNVLHMVHRINVGGEKLTPENDTLWRTWMPDDEYLVQPKNSNKSQPFYGDLKYALEGSINYIAPDYVYRTARENTGSGVYNITWQFKVSKNASHLVRVHFCDIVNSSPDVLFNLYIYSKFNQTINPHEIRKLLAIPFYKDFVVDSGDSGFMNISLSPPHNNDSGKAFLNGLEIMELKKYSSLDEPKKNGMIAMAGSIGAGAFVIIMIIVVFLSLKCKKTKPDESLGWPFSMPRSNSRFPKRTTTFGPASSLNLELRIPYAKIKHATKKFDEKLLVGEGGFGKVYKGTLDGRKVAIKRSEPGHGQGLLQFQTEITVLSQIRHRHLVSLIGYCDEGSEMILVYEFMENGDLRDHVYNSNENSERSYTRGVLTWKQRLEICIGAARGLHYLHTGSARGIIHRDVKSTNILLDEHYVAKVADFGLSKSSPLDPAHDNTDVKGSFGYLDPEYCMTVQLTDKSDVYSFVVVLLEVLCARPAIMTSARREKVSLAEWGMYWQKKGQLEEIIDPVLVGKINPNSLKKFGEIAEKCLKANGSERPNMRDLLWHLEYALQLQQAGIDTEQHNDSTTNTLWAVVPRLPSNNFPVDEIDTSIGGDGGSDTTNSEVFSQMRIDGSR